MTPQLLKRLPTIFIILLVLAGCKTESGKFFKLSPGKTNIHFSNRITESDLVNIFDFPNIYNGGGVGTGDFNNDGLQDLYFTGNMVPNKLYLNKGNMQFEDVTRVSNTDGKGRWSRGVAVVDINNDGWLDMYVCATAKADPMQRINMLYINQGLDKNRVPVFEDMAAAYGLADTSQSTMPYFFDYDNDADLDLYIGVNHINKDEYANTFKKRNLNGEHPSTGRLYRNDWNPTMQHPYYTNVSRQAGILIEGYTHAVNIFDANNDGWQDILVTNDYVSNNVLYINNKDGSFTDKVTEYFKHTSANSMGSDAADLNNDGLEDIVEVDMAPQDNMRKKMFQSPMNYQTYLNSDQFGYQYQYTRNMVQINQGNSMGEMDSISHPVFADAGFYAGIAETDWSWTPLVADYDNDGLRDILFTNGFPKDITDRDFMTFRNQAYSLTSKKDMLAEIPEVKIHNYIYRNTGNLKFTDKSIEWGLEEPCFSNGAAYADLDNDGDLDVIINNINDSSFVYENRILEKDNMHYLDVKLTGSNKNINGIGARVTIWQQGSLQTFVNNPYRGYLSSVTPILHIGLRNATVDSIVIQWPGNMKQVLLQTDVNRMITLNIKDAKKYQEIPSPYLATNNLFTNVTASIGMSYVHKQNDFVDFNIQKLLPHKFSEYAPSLACGDMNGDGMDDFVVGGSPGKDATVFTQQPNGGFTQLPLNSKMDSLHKMEDDRGLLLFDADKDGDLDLYIASGGYNYLPGDTAYLDRFFINNGNGKFTLYNEALPKNTASKFCVRAADFDKDGDLDLFVAGRLVPQNYPKPVSSFIYRNDGHDGKIIFTDVTAAVAPSLQNIGLTCDAIFSDYDNDGWQDLVIGGEWMPITFLHNKQGKFENATAQSGISDQVGWWSSIAAGDVDNDGDVDYIAGNVGLNSFYRTGPGMPIAIYAKDFDNNGSYDAVPALYLKATLDKDAKWQMYPAHGRDDMIKQMIGTRKVYQNYKLFGQATFDKVIPADQLSGALVLKANNLATSYIENKGNGNFTIKPLPLQAQLSAINGMIVEDFDGDGNVDIAINTNDYGTDPTMGRYDGLNGIVLAGKGNGNFTNLTMVQSGICIAGNGKAFTKLKSSNNHYLLVATQNRGPIQVYKAKRNNPVISFMPNDQYAIITLKNGKKQKIENYYGMSFLSQGSRFFTVGRNTLAINITDTKCISRIVMFEKQVSN